MLISTPFTLNNKILAKTTLTNVLLIQDCIYLKIHIYNSRVMQKLKYAVTNVAQLHKVSCYSKLLSKYYNN